MQLRISNKVYDILKLISTLIAPTVVLITSLSEIWGFADKAVPIVATISALEVFIGAVIEISSKTYRESGGDAEGVDS